LAKLASLETSMAENREDVREIKGDVKETKAEVKKTNGKVINLESWRQQQERDADQRSDQQKQRRSFLEQAAITTAGAFAAGVAGIFGYGLLHILGWA
jgi:hypothetical protein